MRLKSLFIACAAALLPASALAKVELPKFLTDSMVVQHDATLTINGHAKKNATVKITPSWAGETIKAKADKKGRFTAKLQTPAAGGPHNIAFDDGEKTALSDIWAGEVWFCSGQSNMEMPVQGWGKVMDYRREVENADYPMVRLLQVKKQISYGEKDDTEVNMGGWRPASPETVANFSAIGYFFGRELNDNLGIPIGIIDCTWGGTPIESWISYEALKQAGEFPEQLQLIADNNFDETDLLKAYQQDRSDWEAKTLHAPADFDITQFHSEWKEMPVPMLWEKSVLPDFNGVVWMQKEFDLAADGIGEPAVLKLAMIDDRDETYLNGVKVGETHRYNEDRAYAVAAEILKPGKNVITVKVSDSSGSGGIWGEGADVCLQIGGKEIPLAGNWKYKVASDFKDTPMPQSPVHQYFPTTLYNAMMHPLTSMPVKGVLWYQGCSNVGRDQQYSKLFKELINSWRADWENPEMPFYFVQLANYLEPKQFQPDSKWAALRQAQKDALSLPYTGMAVAIDLGDANDIHPKNKQEVARRLAAMALNNQYRKRNICNAPEVTKVEINGRYVTLTFDNDIVQHGGGQGYIVLGENGRWARGYGRVTGPRQVEVSSDEIESPVEVRYDWADNPDGNLRGISGLPVAPFIAR